ncbi:hypothetical protein CMUS01_09254 [Colletotrichum musicola]|uniref:Uncharacterized protein n=1 Tax=Colletotrichum musicola TaxID=2175873 RepID=A0A8H6NAW1_9PEZI|nr:hypothetical protein CMUS01_09254 [Colletotrichum musicola]
MLRQLPNAPAAGSGSRWWTSSARATRIAPRCSSPTRLPTAASSTRTTASASRALRVTRAGHRPRV